MPYPLHQSPFFKLRSKRKLAALLGISLDHLRRLATSDNYARFDTSEPGHSARRVEHPKPALMRVHRRILALLERIELPEYLHSARKGRSYRTNAAAHLGDVHVAKLDVRKFYPSTSFEQILRFFRKAMRQGPDVAWMSARICACDGHLPTGSPISALLAFHVHRDMLDEIHAIAVAVGARMTCYIDDLTFSGPRATKRLLWQIASVVAEYRMVAHKFRTYPPTHAKKITGAMVVGGDLRLPNERHRRVFVGLRTLEILEVEEQAKLTALRKLRGGIADAKSLDPLAAARMLYRWKKLSAPSG